MSLTRREFLQMLALAGAAGVGLPGCERKPTATDPAKLYELPGFGNVTLLHFTDCHAQLLPIHFREPSINIGVAEAKGRPPHLVGEALLRHFDIAPGSIEAHAFTFLDFEKAARKYGKVGGFAHMATLVKQLRAGARCCSTAATPGKAQPPRSDQRPDMVDAQKLLGVDMMTDTEIHLRRQASGKSSTSTSGQDRVLPERV